ncbi:rCG31987 [Rattus norvegicus]|uniref:RCG31987 n=1 Tax=Rattus norvegicus TaxID=10116 RepID=A6KDU3_RAT|nr:rCG31987 [Rattus norvegicus]
MPSFLRESFTSTRMYLSSAEKASCSKATASSRATLTRLGHRQTPDVKKSPVVLQLMWKTQLLEVCITNMGTWSPSPVTVATC